MAKTPRTKRPTITADVCPVEPTTTTADVSVDATAPAPVVVATPDVPGTVFAFATFDPATFPDTYRAAVATATRNTADGPVPLFGDPGIVATLTAPSCVAIAAGMVACRHTADTRDAVNTAVATFDAVASAIHAPTSAATINVGRYMGRKIMDGQNVMYAIAAVVNVPDTAIAAAWRAEWPNAKCDFADRRDHVTTTRPVVNRGGHGWTNGHGGTADVVRAWGGRFVAYNVDGTIRR